VHASFLAILLALFFVVGNPIHPGALNTFPLLIAMIPFPIVLTVRLRYEWTRNRRHSVRDQDLAVVSPRFPVLPMHLIKNHLTEFLPSLVSSQYSEPRVIATGFTIAVPALNGLRFKKRPQKIAASLDLGRRAGH